ncbi:MAG: PAS domain S-box protein [Spirochaetia bacterium]|nr:PAS domain S-box protein [Spirochaetia bacterium]
MKQSPLNILLIEDDKAYAFLFQEIIQSMSEISFQLEISYTLKEALKNLKRKKTDLIFLDLGLPDSYQLSAVYEITKNYKTLPIIVLTGLTDKEAAKEALRLGVQDYLIKSQISAEILEKSIRYGIERNMYKLKLEESESKYRMLIEKMREGLVVYDKKENITYINPQMSRMLGSSFEEVVGRPFGKFFLFNEKEKKNQLVNKSKFEIELEPKKGPRLNCIVSFEQLFDEQNKKSGKLAILTDITKQKKAEKELKEEKDFISAVIETAGAFILVLNKSGSILRSNRFSREFFQLSEEEIAGKKFWEIFSKEKNEKLIKDKISYALSENNFASFEEEFLIKQTKKIYVSWSFAALYAETKKESKIICIGLDMTEKIQAEAALFESEKKFQMLVESMNEGFIVEDKDQKIIYSNNKFKQMSGYTLQELINKPLKKFLAKSSYLRLENKLKSQDSNGSYEIFLRKKDKSELPVLFSVRKLSDIKDGYKGRFAVITDVSAIKKTENFLRTALLGYARISKELRLFIDTASAPIFAVNLQGLITEWNGSAELLTGFHKKNIIGDSLYDYIHSENVNFAYDIFKKAKNGEKTPTFELRFKTSKKDIEVVFLLNATPRLDSNNNIVGIWSVGQDITELSSYRAKLIEMVEERTRQIEEVLDREKDLTLELKESLAKEKELSNLKSRFVSMVSHEFRTPLTAILSSTEILQHYDDRMDKSQKAEKLNKIHKEVYRMTHLVEDILTLGQAEAGKIELNPVLINIDKFCNEIIEEMKIMSNAKYNIVFQNLCHEDNILLDERILFHTITNLLSNAVKYSYEGSKIYLTVKLKDENFVLSVKDEGIGISDEDKKYILDPFFRGKNVGNRKGIGLGLSVMSVFLKEQNGTIDIKSEKDKGSIFTVTIPLQMSLMHTGNVEGVVS